MKLKFDLFVFFAYKGNFTRTKPQPLYHVKCLFSTAWGITKNSEFTGLLNHWLQKFDETGLKERLWKQWTYKGGEEFGVDEATTLGFENLTFPFMFIAEGFVGACIFLIFEICLGKKRNQAKKVTFGNGMIGSIKVFKKSNF